MDNVRNRKRRTGITVMLTEQERQELQKAADASGLALSVFIRVLAVTVLRRGETVGIDADAKVA